MRIRFFFIAFLLISSITFSQHNGWQNYTDSRHVTGVASDGNYWWIATTGGLIKINIETGAKTVYNHANSGLPSNNLTCIDIDPNSDLTLWIGTVEGIAVYNRQQSWTVFDMENTPLPSNHITSLDYHESNIVLIGTTAGAVLRSGGNWTVYDEVNFYIDAVYVERINSLYVGAGGNVFHGDGLTWTNIGAPSGNITAIKKDGSIYLWVSTYGNGVFSFDGYNWTNYDSYNSPFTSNNFTWLDVDSDNNLWTACYGQLWKRTAIGNWEYQYIEHEQSVSIVKVINNDFLAVGCYDGFFSIEQPGLSAEFTEYDITNSPFELLLNDETENHITSIFIDDESDSKYIGGGGQIFKFSNLNAHLFSEYPFDNSYAIADIITDHYGRVWACSDRANTVSMRGADSWTQNSNPDDNNKCLFWEQTSAASGILWVGGEYTGLKSFDDPVWTSYPLDPYGILTRNISEIVLDADGNIWITGGHLEKFDGTNTVDYTNENNQFIQVRTTCLAKEENTLWIGSLPISGAPGGIDKYDGTDFTNYYTDNSDLPGNFVTKIVVDNNGRKYVGTTEGLTVFDDVNNMTVYTRKNSGLPDDHITDMDIDDDGNLWIGTMSGGLAILGYANITAIEEDEIVSPSKYVLEQNYPNPFNPTTTIKYSLPLVERKSPFAPKKASQSGDWIYNVKLSVYDILGREVAELVNKEQAPGNYSVQFSAENLSSGIYFYKLNTGNFRDVKKMIILK